MPKTIRNFFWPITDHKTLQQFQLFVKLSVVRGVHHSEILAELIHSYNKDFIERNNLKGVRLVEEKNLIALLGEAKTPVSRLRLNKYRESGKLVGGPIPLFWTDGRRVVYNFSACRTFFRQSKTTA